MNFVFLVIAAQFLNALVVLADKYLVTAKRSLGQPLVYAFYVALLSGAVIVILPFSFVQDGPFGIVFPPSAKVVVLSLLTAGAFVSSLIFLYKSLKISDASDVAPTMGALTAVFTLVFSFLFLGDRLGGSFLYGFLFLAAGTALMSYFRFNLLSATFIVAAGLLFGLSSVFVKMLFFETTFIDGFFWSRMANVIVALSLLLWPGVLNSIKHRTAAASRGSKWLVVGNKALAGFAFLLILLAINVGNVSVVSALGGVQFVFLLLFALVFTKKLPGYLYETVHARHIVWQKVVATGIIVTGLVFLFI